jgi:hypothetical protein
VQGLTRCSLIDFTSRSGLQNLRLAKQTGPLRMRSDHQAAPTCALDSHIACQTLPDKYSSTSFSANSRTPQTLEINPLIWGLVGVA